jgi:hypothetical protein
MWILAHVGFEGNEIVARHVVLNGAVFEIIKWISGYGKICFAERLAGEAGRCEHW